MERELFGGKVIVIAGHDAQEKPLPDGLDPNYEWIGNFGLQTTGTTTTDYEILVEKKGNKKIVWWNGTKAVPFPTPKSAKRDNKDYISVRSNLVDPPIGYGN